MKDSQDHRTRAYEEVSSSSSHTKTSEVHSGQDSDQSIQLQAKPKASGRTPKKSVGVALQDKRRRQNMLGAVELAGAMQVEPSSDTSDASILYDMADQAVNLAASRAGWQTRTEPPAPRTALSAPSTSIAPASSCKATPSLPPPPLRHHLSHNQRVSIALPLPLRDMLGMLFSQPVVRTCTQS